MADLSPAPDTAAAQASSASPVSSVPPASSTARPHGLDVVTGTKPRPEPLDPPMVPFAAGGLVAFALTALICWLAGAPDSWTRTAVAGFVVGIPGLITMLRHDSHRRRRRALTHPEFTVDDPA